MKNRFIIATAILTALMLSGCRQAAKEIASVSFPEPPVEILTNESVGMNLINYFNIINLPEGGYGRYFSGYKADECGPDWDNQNLYYASQRMVFITS